MSPFLALLARDMKLAIRVGGGALMGALFYFIVVAMMPFAIGPDLNLLARIGPAILWLGALLADVFAGRLPWRWSWVAVGAALAGMLALCYGGPLHDLGMGLIFAAVLAGGFLLQEKKKRLLWLEKLKPLGDMSYTLYVTHFPILVLASGWLMSRSANSMLPQHFGWVFGGIAVTTAVAYGLHFIVERPFLSRGTHGENKESRK